MAPARPQQRKTTSRERVLGAVRDLLEEGTFHESTVEQVADRAGVSRATVYGHFGSRVGLVDAMCELFDATPELIAIRTADDLDSFFALVVGFWSREEKALVQLYGAAALDPASADLVERQRRDRYGEIRRILRALGRTDAHAFSVLALLTSFETYLELRHAGRSRSAVVQQLRQIAQETLGL